MSGITLYNNNRPAIVKYLTTDTLLGHDDNNATLIVNSATDITIYLNNLIPGGDCFRLVQKGIGRVIVAGLAGVTIINPYSHSSTSIAGDYINILAGQPGEFFLQTVGTNSGAGAGGGPIKAISANFTDATNLDSPQFVGQPLGIFLNEINRYLENDEWAATATGINILIPEFNATINSYTLYISILTALTLPV
jgi:hypothetical protein